jgi:hypothetical protein
VTRLAVGKLLCFILQTKILGPLKFTPACMRIVRIPIGLESVQTTKETDTTAVRVKKFYNDYPNTLGTVCGVYVAI